MKIKAIALIAVVSAIGYLLNSYLPADNVLSSSHEIVQPPLQIQEYNNNGIASKSQIEATVVKVTDGDTFEISYMGKKNNVRLLCVDTPESVKAGVPLQPYGKDATEFVKSRVLDKKVRLIFDKGLRDRYGRLLAYVILSNGDFLNALLVKEGYARVEIVSPNTSLSKYFFELQQAAIKEKNGFWGMPEDKQPFKKGKNGLYIPRYMTEKKAS